MPDPKDLMARYCDGDDVAFREIYHLRAPRRFGYMVNMAREHATAADLLQHTFIKVHRARAAYIRDADPIPWIYAIAHRVFLDSYRKSKRDIVRARARACAEPRPVWTPRSSQRHSRRSTSFRIRCARPSF